MHRCWKITLAILISLVSARCYAEQVTFSTDANFLLVGDSFTNGGDREWAGKVNAAPEFSLTFFSASGRTLSQIDSLFSDQYTDNTYDAVVLAAGVNDIFSGRSFAEIRTSIESIIAQTDDEYIVLTTIPPFRAIPSWTQGLQNVADEVDSWILSYAANSPDSISVFDIRGILDQDDDQIIDDEFRNGPDDNLHPRGCALGQECGQSVIGDRFISQFVAVPEPSSTTLLCLGVFAIQCCRRR